MWLVAGRSERVGHESTRRRSSAHGPDRERRHPGLAGASHYLLVMLFRNDEHHPDPEVERRAQVLLGCLRRDTDQLEDRGDRPRPPGHVTSEALRQAARQVLDDPAARHVSRGVEQPVAGELEHEGRVDRRRLEELVDERTAQRRQDHLEGVAGPHQQRVPNQREAVRVHPRGGEADQHVPVSHPVRPESQFLLDDPDAEPREVERVFGHHARVLRRLAAQQRTPRPPAALGDPRDDRGHALGVDRAHGEVVEEEQGFGAGADDIVGAHRHQVDPDGVEPARAPRDLELRADAVRGGGEEPAVADLEQPGEPSDALDELGSRRPASELTDQLDRLPRRVQVDAGPPVRLRAHDFAGCSSRNLPACSGIGIGYSPSKQARQNEPASCPVAATIPPSDRYPSESAPT